MQGPEQKKLSLKMTRIESAFESSCQILVLFFVWSRTGFIDVTAVVSSILMIGKTGAESFLTFGCFGQFEEASFPKKLLLIGKYTPVFALTSVSRIGTLSSTNKDNVYMFIIFFKTCLPFMVAFGLRLLRKNYFTVGEICQGVLTEVTGMYEWGRGQRNIQLIMAAFHFAVDMTILSIMLFVDQKFFGKIVAQLLGRRASTQYNSVVNDLALISLTSGLVAAPLFLFQIYWAEKYNIKNKMDTFALSNVR